MIVPVFMVMIISVVRVSSMPVVMAAMTQNDEADKIRSETAATDDEN